MVGPVAYGGPVALLTACRTLVCCDECHPVTRPSRVLWLSCQHTHRIMHRDIKPSNVFLSADGVVKLGDLGLSRYFSSKTQQAQSMVGTPYYMSPECIRGQPYEWSSDTWSLGCLLYELGRGVNENKHSTDVESTKPISDRFSWRG